MIRLRILISKVQVKFRERLSIVKQRLALERKERADERAQVAAKRWKEYVAELNAWQKSCKAATCQGCGRHKRNCLCDRSVKTAEIVAMLRNLAGINPSHSVAGYFHDEDSSNGPSGYRVCGKNSWDNAVRAHDEDR